MNKPTMTSEFMDIKDYDSDYSVSQDILDLSNLGTRVNQVKFAICERALIKRSVDGKPFVRYTLKDLNGKRITGRQFAIEHLQDKFASLSTIKDRVVKIKFTVDYFNGYYLNVESLNNVPDEIAVKIRDSFFNTSLPKLKNELSFLEENISTLPMSKETADVIKLYNIYDKLANGYYEDISQGLKGSPVKMANMFIGNVINTFSPKEGKYLIISYLMLESIMCVNKDPKDVLKELSVLSGIISSNINPESRRLYDIVESSIYTIYNFEKDIYDSSSIYLVNARQFIQDSLREQNMIEQQINVFEYHGRIYEKR